ncbi:hypothetical protein [Mycolicibacter arupensis]|uniref:Uncharacterized protein n=1 Tax=Mycolicibacter arupensis TaxID=342002 RepID=A0ABX3RR11_9MYCO|nr:MULTISPECIES: hypothetical protein [Mycobacteriaceae]MCV7274083.1 hypothetical protein [Mycolicibacter arupensis]OQZ96596.1 hypothetical protein BST15_11890 [Mycolicibacter arupensis]
MATADGPAGTYADHVTITFNQVSDRSSGCVLDSFQIGVNPNGTIDLEWLTDEIKGVFLQPPDPETGIRYPLDNYILAQRRTEMSWGASASVFQFIVDTASGIGKAGAGAVVGAAINELVQKLKALGYQVITGKPGALSDDEAIRRGLNAIETHYETTLSDLSARSVEKNEFGQHVVAASDSGGSTYTVTFVVRGGVTDVVSRSHTLPTGN